MDELLNKAASGDRRALARLISEVVDRPDPEMLSALSERRDGSHIVGITGPPGAGKSSLVDLLIAHYRAGGSRPGVVVVDPSSPFTGGAILGDRIRMQRHSDDPEVFIRSLANRGRMGGLAFGTDAALAALDAAGFSPLLVETVGVGQSEVDVVGVADTVVVVLHPTWGDEVQAAKAGLLEVADVFCINKSDLGDASGAVAQLHQMLTMGAHREWTPPIMITSALNATGIDELAGAIDDHRQFLIRGGGRRDARREAEFRRAVVARAESIAVSRSDLLEQVIAGDLDPWTAAKKALERDPG